MSFTMKTGQIVTHRGMETLYGLRMLFGTQVPVGWDKVRVGFKFVGGVVGTGDGMEPRKDVQTYVEGTAAARGTATSGRGTIEGFSCPAHTGGKNWPPTAYNPIQACITFRSLKAATKRFPKSPSLAS